MSSVKWWRILIKHDFSNKLVLITGGTGAVGSRLLDFFNSHGATTIGTYLNERRMLVVQNLKESNLFDVTLWKMLMLPLS